jgi:hypothetical protein
VAGGYLVGGGLVWATRILGTLAFGREAMGMGDVHLLAAIGAALGWHDALAVFLIAPFLGLAFAATVAILATRPLAWVLGGRFAGARGRLREIPYGPYLAAAAALVVFARPAIVSVREAILSPVAAAAESGAPPALHLGGERVQCHPSIPAGGGGLVRVKPVPRPMDAGPCGKDA